MDLSQKGNTRLTWGKKIAGKFMKEALKAISQFQLSCPEQDMNPQPLAFMAGALITTPPSRLQTCM